MKIRATTLFLFFYLSLAGQADSTQKKLQFTADFRFRIEHDWHSRKPDGTFRDDRSRLRYRFRLGAGYQLNAHAMFAGRLRSGHADDQQGPHISLGEGNGEFGLVPIGLEKLYFRYKRKWFSGWAGKNAIVLEKSHELFWNDNVYPEGIGLTANWPLKNKAHLHVNAGHYIIQSRGKGFSGDSYLQVLQPVGKFWKERLTLGAGAYYFHNIGNLPDGNSTYRLSYAIVHLSGRLLLMQRPKLEAGLDFFDNRKNYNRVDEVPAELKNEKKGYAAWFKVGELKKKGDWCLHVYAAHLERYAIVDYFAQNDWIRWDYSAVGSPASRLSNFRGMELRLGYAIGPDFNLQFFAWVAEQLVPQEAHRETGNRIRLDLNIGF